MSFRTRQTLATAAAVAVAIVAASALVYLLVRDQLENQVDEALREQASFVSRAPLGVEQDPASGGLVLRIPPRGFGRGENVFVQAVRSDGEIARADPNQVAFPVSNGTLEVARGERGEFFTDETVAGTHVRILTVPIGQEFALQVVRPLGEVDQLLRRIGAILLFVAIGGIGVAAVLGALVAKAALTPVRRLTKEAEIVAKTQDLTHRIHLHGTDELSRLGASFNTMLAALDDSQRSQRRLVADASHELGTPLTSVRTNIEVLTRTPDLPAEKREALLRDLVGQLEEMSLLVRNLVELASEPQADLEPAEIQLDVLVQEAVERAERLAPQIRFTRNLEGTVVRGVPSRLERAIANVLDNAVKWSPPGGPIEVRVADGEVSVRDHGPGIDDADLPHVFDRFYRAPSARPLPGSGLGLSVVQQVVGEHHGTIAIEKPEGGGTLVTLRLAEAKAPVSAL